MTKAIIAKEAHQSQEVETELNKHITLARVETNFEKLPIWSTKPKRGTTFVPSKVIELEPETLSEGQVVERKIKIVPSAEYGYPTVQTQEYWYALQLLWHDSPAKEAGRIDFSRRQIIEDILGKKYGSDQRKALDLSLLQLAYTGFAFDFVFYDKEQDITHHEIRHFHIISDLHLTERKNQSEVVNYKCSVTLHPLIVSNLRSGYFKPVILSVVSELKSDIARLLYRKIDLQFSHIDKYEISTKRFFEEHGIEGKKYDSPSGRKQLIERGIQELIGKPTSKEVTDKSGKTSATIASYKIVKTKDQKDYKLIVYSSGKNTVKTTQPKRQQRKEKITHSSSTTSQVEQPKQKIQEKKEGSSLQRISVEGVVPKLDTPAPSSSSSRTVLPQRKEQIAKVSPPPKTTENPEKNLQQTLSESVELFAYFDHVFFNDSGVKPSKKEMKEVEKVVKKHGLEKSKFLVDYAYEQSKNSSHQPRTFMGIVRDIGVADKNRLFEEHKRHEAAQSSYRVSGEEQRRKVLREEYQRKYEPEYYQYILSLKEAFTYQYPQELVAFGKWEAAQRQELEDAVAKASSKTLWLYEKQLKMFDGREGLQAIRFIEYFAGHEKIKLPDFWQWEQKNFNPPKSP